MPIEFTVKSATGRPSSACFSTPTSTMSRTVVENRHVMASPHIQRQEIRQETDARSGPFRRVTWLLSRFGKNTRCASPTYRQFHTRYGLCLSWGGSRGGISIVQTAYLSKLHEKPVLLAATYFLAVLARNVDLGRVVHRAARMPSPKAVACASVTGLHSASTRSTASSFDLAWCSAKNFVSVGIPRDPGRSEGTALRCQLFMAANPAIQSALPASSRGEPRLRTGAAI